MSDSQKNFYKKLLGKKGERAVISYMKKLGYKLIIANYSTPFGEADCVFARDGVIFFVEVKTRTGKLFGEPKDAVDYKKQEKYRKIAQYYMLNNGESEISFVVAEVTKEGINLIENAF